MIGLWGEVEDSFGVLFEGVEVPIQGGVFDVRPHDGHINIVGAAGVAGLAGGVDEERVGEIVQVHN